MINTNIYGKRAIAFLDILGFKNMLDSMDLKDIATKYENIIKQITELSNHYSTFETTQQNATKLCKQFVFSDSIILIANEDNESSFIDLITYVWRFLQLSIAMGMPIRGAISYGEIYMNEKLNIFLGKGLTTAYKLEGMQQWVGVILDKIVEEKYNKIFSTNENKMILNEMIIDYDVPFKNGNRNKFKTVNWRLNLVVKKGTKSLFSSNQGNKDVEEKIKNTLIFAKTVIERKKTYIYGEEVPHQFRTCYIGDTEPPFNHGDEL